MEEDDEPPSPAAFVSLAFGLMSGLSALCCCVPVASWLTVFTTPLLFGIGLAAGVLAVQAPGRKTIGILGLVLNGIAAALFAFQALGYCWMFGVMALGT